MCGGVGVFCVISSDLRVLRYARVRRVVWKGDLASASFVLVAGSGCFTYCDANATSPHVCMELDVDLRAATISRANQKSGHAWSPVYFA